MGSSRENRLSFGTKKTKFSAAVKILQVMKWCRKEDQEEEGKTCLAISGLLPRAVAQNEKTKDAELRNQKLEFCKSEIMHLG